MVDSQSICSLLLEAGRITRDDFLTALAESKRTGKSPQEILVKQGKVSVDELVQAIAIHLDITLLKEALGMESDTQTRNLPPRPLGSYLERISLLFKTGLLMSRERSMSSLMEILLQEAPSVMNAERATIFLADYETRELYSHLGVGLRQGQIRIPWDTGIAGAVFVSGQSLNVPDPYNDPRFNKHVDPRTGFTTRNLLCVPLKVPGGPVIGVFQVLNKRAGVFTSTDKEILEILASQAARSIEKVLEWDSVRKSISPFSQTNVDRNEALREEDPLDLIIGTSAAMKGVRSLVRKVAPTDSTVLIQGESGTGKELIARAIHGLSARRKAPLVILNCSAVPSELIESELFGHKKGSFTGATGDTKGVFSSAHGGTLFLDEIEATSPAMQVKLLRAIQIGEIRPVGDNVSHTVDVRLITATNKDLAGLVDAGEFREDLFYRINVFPVTIPPLRERREDIPLLVAHFLRKLARQSGKRVESVDLPALDLLVRYPWPGNVRELENEIERAHVLAGEEHSISVGRLSERITRSVEQLIKTSAQDKRPSLKEAVEDLEYGMIRQALAEAQGNRTVAAKSLGLSRQGLLNKMARYGMSW